MTEEKKRGVEFSKHASEFGRLRFGADEQPRMAIPEPYKSAHAYCWKNRVEIEASATCGCFYCGQVYPSSEIWEFHDEEQTGFCPKCGIDAIIPSSSGVPLTTEFLDRMNYHWFGHGFVKPYGS
jgi:hypothetical protein